MTLLFILELPFHTFPHLLKASSRFQLQYSFNDELAGFSDGSSWISEENAVNINLGVAIDSEIFHSPEFR